jgi:flavin-dependent dehydrogenase
MEAFDAAVIGRGPAGYATAIALRQRGFRVLTLGRTDLSASRWGETVPGSTAVVLSRLGLSDALDPMHHAPCVAHRSCWGEGRLRERTAMQNPHGGGTLIAHDRLIGVLDERLRSLDGHIGEGQVSDVMRDDGGYRLQIGADAFVHARAIVDATGRGARIAQRFGAQRTMACRLVSVGATFAASPGYRLPVETLVEARPDGWLYAAPLANARAVVWWLTEKLPSHLTRTERTHRLMREIGASLHIGAWLAEHRLTIDGSSVVRDASVSALDRNAGDGWLAVGDAAISLDPLSSSGITSALMGGLHAATALDGALSGDTHALRRYGAAIDAVFDAHLKKRRQFYALERRWDSAFWQRMAA